MCSILSNLRKINLCIVHYNVQTVLKYCISTITVLFSCTSPLITYSWQVGVVQKDTSIGTHWLLRMSNYQPWNCDWTNDPWLNLLSDPCQPELSLMRLLKPSLYKMLLEKVICVVLDVLSVLTLLGNSGSKIRITYYSTVRFMQTEPFLDILCFLHVYCCTHQVQRIELWQSWEVQQLLRISFALWTYRACHLNSKYPSVIRNASLNIRLQRNQHILLRRQEK